ncbi:MAG: monofunctional biosynthetic peptidoglycan transglycosylase [Myxococcales bacterium]
MAFAAAVCLAAFAAAFWLQLPSAEPLRKSHPASTALIDARSDEARARGRAARRIQQWVPLDRISPWLQDAVVNSEDARFYFHHGIDTVEFNRALQKAMEDGKLGRGASTLTQQLAKNLWLGEERSLFRKAKEYLLAQRLEHLGKDRILELYLNEVEWGEGIYGAEAAARTWFRKPAAALSPEEAAVLTAMLPAPRRRNPRRPSAHLRARAWQVLDLFGLYRQMAPRELDDARARLGALIGPP